MQNLRGKLLLASPEMGDPNFARSVILIVQHGPDGALGLVLNQPTGAAVGDVLSAMGDDAEVDCGVDEPLYRGGPCDGPLMVLHQDPVHAQELVTDGVYFASEREYVEPALSGAVSPVRFYAGYSGWGAGQLEGELAQSAWSVMDASLDAVFPASGDTPVSDEGVWKSLIRVKTTSELLKGYNPNILPRDPSMN
ncbi:YqgE/AlgH family protein [Algisphaera agarilytica]|uniref:Putative transcriptional regulator n=1 Tax=Algisphaera agarilytica TaxID=1385975 RepID=A0A7X0H8S4_9BACT|nr:YqgE/AlgH family protein [Algisphaera agarilytica]MBB6431167.1 putative transcriptional regulator [Algisphaera agarilytica]